MAYSAALRAQQAACPWGSARCRYPGHRVRDTRPHDYGGRAARGHNTDREDCGEISARAGHGALGGEGWEYGQYGGATNGAARTGRAPDAAPDSDRPARDAGGQAAYRFGEHLGTAGEYAEPGRAFDPA